MFGLALRRSGFGCVGTSEIDPHAAAVTAYHYPQTPALGDVRNVATTRADLIVAGFPCQDLSVAGSRGGLAGERSGLFWEIVRIARASTPRWLLLENVPGLLSSNGGRDMGAVLGALGELGYGWAYRVLDARHFGVPQRRKRVFFVGCLGDSRRAAKVLFEPESVRGDSAPSRQARAGSAGGVGVGSSGDVFRSSGLGEMVRSSAAGTLRASGGDIGGGTESLVIADLVQMTSADNRSNPQPGDPDPTMAHTSKLTAFNWRGDDYAPKDQSPCLDGCGAGSIASVAPSGVRRLMPIECERLQGLPETWTKHGRRPDGTTYEQSDSARYRMIGNGGAVPVVEWIARRIAAVALVLLFAAPVAASPLCVAAVAHDWGATSTPEPPWALSTCEIVASSAKRHGLRPALVVGVSSVESCFTPYICSPSNACGAMQVKQRYHCRTLFGWRACLTSRSLIEAGVRHLAELVEIMPERRALRCYNAGRRGCAESPKAGARYAAAVIGRERRY